MSSCREVLHISFGTTLDLCEVQRLAREYQYPHSVLGCPNAAEYIRALEERVRLVPGSGWYCASSESRSVVAAVHASVYGYGDRNGHTLWKLRHPLVDEVPGATVTLAALLQFVSARVVEVRPSSAKLVILLGEHELEARSAAADAKFCLEGVLTDYYRLGEQCLVYGKTNQGALK
jgi:hypothetical protein